EARLHSQPGKPDRHVGGSSSGGGVKGHGGFQGRSAFGGNPVDQDFADAQHLHQRILAVNSTSTAAPRGSSATPTAARAWRPRSPRTSTRRSEAPLITFGWPVKPGAEATKPPKRR